MIFHKPLASFARLPGRGVWAYMICCTREYVLVD